VTVSPGSTAVSFEVYPPKKPEGLKALHESLLALDSVNPEFISVTFGAGGSSTRDSLDVLRYIRDNTAATPLAHLTCVGTTKSEVAELIHTFLGEGINHFLALRGDLPHGESEHRGELPHASDLVALMKSLREKALGPERIAVAAFPNGHPESPSRQHDIEALLIKQNAGASLAITQLFFYSSDYERFVLEARAAGVTIPIIPGLMPILSPARLTRVLELSGEQRPTELSDALDNAVDTTHREAIGVEWTAKMVRELLDAGAPGIHLYAFNQHHAVLSVLREAGVR
jgi:methylenetetrahydrofolate reductase (NADPH)